jgi:dethiobiotin synthetase/adenosylmethionine--8-amino-7-oxononanoate aminotransferase
LFDLGTSHPWSGRHALLVKFSKFIQRNTTNACSDPLFQRTLVNVVRSNSEIFGTDPAPTHSDVDWKGLPVIFDEVFTGLYRLGTFTPSSLLYIHPDITVHAKLLTGGLVPLCATTASDSIYAAFLGDQKSDALLHGHSYTAHAVGCEVARTSLQTMIDMDRGEKWNAFKQAWAEEKFPKGFDSATSPRMSLDADPSLYKETQPHLWSMWSQSFLRRISHARQVESVIALGSVLAINLRDGENKGYSSTAASGLQASLLQRRGEELGDYNIHSRVLGNVLYLIMSQTSEIETVIGFEKRLFDDLNI